MELLLGQCAKERAGPDQATADGDAAARSFGVDPDGNPRRQAPQKRWRVGDQVAIGLVFLDGDGARGVQYGVRDLPRPIRRDRIRLREAARLLRLS